MVPSRDRCAPQSEHTDAVLQRSQQPRSRIGHAKSDCPLHQAREASSLSAIHRARHTASLAILRVLCCDHQPLSESQQVIRHRLVRLPPCLVNLRRGHPKMGGRKKGTPNRIPGIFKKALYEAADRVGFAGTGEDGTVGYFVWIGRRYPTFYYLKLFGRFVTMDDDDIAVIETSVPEQSSPPLLTQTERTKLGRRGHGQNKETRSEPAQGPMPLAEMVAMVGTIISEKDPRIKYEDLVRVLMRLAVEVPK